jgi:hypothetical protein
MVKKCNQRVFVAMSPCIIGYQDSLEACLQKSIDVLLYTANAVSEMERSVIELAWFKEAV